MKGREAKGGRLGELGELVAWSEGGCRRVTHSSKTLITALSQDLAHEQQPSLTTRV